MKRYRCVKCGSEWYTANLREGSKCDKCQGDLQEQQDLFDLLCDCLKALNNKDQTSEDK